MYNGASIATQTAVIDAQMQAGAASLCTTIIRVVSRGFSNSQHAVLCYVLVLLSDHDSYTLAQATLSLLYTRLMHRHAI